MLRKVNFHWLILVVIALFLPDNSVIGQTITWTGAGDGVTWSQGTNWAGGAAPSAGTDAVLGPGGTVNITVTTAVRSLTTARAVEMPINCTTLTITNGLTFSSSSGSLTGSTASISSCDAVRFVGNQSISGPGRLIARTGFVRIATAGTIVTIAPECQVGATGSGNVYIDAGATLVNQGTMKALASQSLSINGAAGAVYTIALGATLEVNTGGGVGINSVSWNNLGTLLINGGSMTLNGVFSDLGAVSRSGGNLLLTGSGFTGPLLTATAATGDIGFSSFYLTGTTLNALDGRRFLASNFCSLSGVTLNAPLEHGGSCNNIRVTNGLTLGPEGAITTNQSTCVSLIFSGSSAQTVSGSGRLNIRGGGMRVEGGAYLTLAPGITLESGSNDAVVDVTVSSRLINQGVIRCSGAGRSLALGQSSTGLLTNAAGGTIEASNGASLSIGFSSWTNAGTLVLNGASMGLYGSFPALGSINRTGGVLSIAPSAFSGPSLTADALTGPIILTSGAMTGKTLNAIDGQSFTASGSITLTSVTLNGPLTMSDNCNTLTVTGGLSLGPAGVLTTGATACQTLLLSGSQAISGAGMIRLSRGQMAATGVGANLSIGSGATVETMGPAARIVVSNGSTLTNTGTLRATGTGRVLEIASTGSGSFVNATGTVRAGAAGQLRLSLPTSNTGSIIAEPGGTVTISAGSSATLATGSLLQVQGTGPTPADFGAVVVQGSLAAGGSFTVTCPDGSVPRCYFSLPVIVRESGGVVTNAFAQLIGPVQPRPYVSVFSVGTAGYSFVSTNGSDLGSTGAVANGDGLLDNNDFIVFIDLFFAGNSLADRGSTGGTPTSDGAFDNNDFIVFIDEFFAGC